VFAYAFLFLAIVKPRSVVHLRVTELALLVNLLLPPTFGHFEAGVALDDARPDKGTSTR